MNKCETGHHDPSVQQFRKAGPDRCSVGGQRGWVSRCADKDLPEGDFPGGEHIDPLDRNLSSNASGEVLNQQFPDPGRAKVEIQSEGQ